MGAADDELLHTLGVSLAGEIAWLTTITLFYGIFILLFAFTMSTVLRRGLTSRPTWAMFLIVLISFLIVTLHWTAETAAVAIFVRSALVSNIGLPLDVKRTLTNIAGFSVSLVTGWTSGILPIISDVAVIWRAWVLFPERRWVIIGPIILLLATIATTFSHLIIFSKISPLTDARFPSNLWRASLGTSIATNAFATFLIAYKLWSYRNFVINYVDQNRRQTPVQKALILLIESGFFYFVLQLITLVFNDRGSREVQSSAKYFAGQVFFAAYTALSGMYPTIVVALVNSQRSFMDNYGLGTVFKTEKDDPGHISFAGNSMLTMDSSPTQTSHAVLKEDNGGDSLVTLKRIGKDEEDTYGRHAITAPF